MPRLEIDLIGVDRLPSVAPRASSRNGPTGALAIVILLPNS